MSFTRRRLLEVTAATLAGSALRPRAARGQTPKRGGTLTIRAWDPPFFDQMLSTA